MTSLNRVETVETVIGYWKLHKQAAFDVRISDWEEGFLEDWVERFEKYGRGGISVSDKQFASLERLRKKFEEAGQ